MNFGQAVDQVVSVLKRPDKAADTKDAINEAIFFAAARNFSRDLVEITHSNISSTLYAQRVDLTHADFVRYKKIKYLRPTGRNKYLKWTDPAAAYNNNVACRDVWYQSGTGLIINMSSLVSSLEIGYFQYHATMVADADTDWMLDLILPVIKARALATMFGNVGDDQERARKEAEAQRLLEVAVIDFADGVSRA